MKTVLFICTHNSVRSQMAEAFLNYMYGDKYRAYSAGTTATPININAIKVMEEIGISIKGQRSKPIEEFRGWKFDIVVTVCDHAKETCPFFPGKLVMHRGFPDPSELKGSEDEILKGFRKVRDEIREWVEKTFGKEDVDGNKMEFTMKNLNEKEVKNMAIDPVCKMEVDEKTAKHITEYMGKKYYFCAPGCKKTFEENPEKYIGSAEGHKHHHGCCGH